ncbi:hypothetical protein [Tateyamaria sp.]|uniref:hypothetical protein n=1 Tax=Tateyamaria sp. TaxID=1929288 RepID=UPI00329ABA94
MTTETKTDTATTAPQDTWERASAILVALHQTHLKAQTEYQQIVEAAQGNPFARGTSAAGHLIQTLNPALRLLEADMRDHARANGLEMPKLE